MMEQEFEIIESGLLSEVNGESDIIDDSSQEIVPTMRTRRAKSPKSSSASKVSPKVLNYLGVVKVTTSFQTRNSKAWLLQSLLNELGYSLKPDGFFGQLTEAQVKKFQADNGLVADGIVGQATWNELIYQGRCRISNSKIGDKDYEDAAKVLGVEVAVVKAVKDVEAGGAGYVFSNHPTILFESHVFWRELKKRGIVPSKYRDKEILNQTQKKGKAYYVGGVGEYARLLKACLINTDAANASASWGLFQIMGNNYKACGCRTIDAFVKLMSKGEREQLMLFMEFIKNNDGMLSCLKKKDWEGFACRYNGSDYKDNNYHIKLQNAYNKYKR
jgi:hypothetical protein